MNRPFSRKTDHNQEEKEDGLLRHIKRQTKRFYVGGFQNTITEKEIFDFVTSRGLRVSHSRIFPNKRNSSVVIRLNVFDNDKSSFLLDPYFWPDDISCRPWLSYNQYKRRFQSRYDHSEERMYSNPSMRSVWCDDTDQIESFENTNRFLCLEIDVD